MNVGAFSFGFGKIVIPFFAVAFMGAVLTAQDAQPGSFEIRQVVDEKDSAGAETLPFAHVRQGGESSLRVTKEAVLDGADVARAVAQKDPITGDYGVLVTLTEKGKERFATVTERSVGKRLAVIVDGKIVTAPVVRTKIPGGSLVVSGNLTAKEAGELAEKLNGEGGGNK
jgi:preprotein translocase subunit SecD